MDRVSPERRSANMRAVRGRDTAPEMAVRRAVHGMGYRYRLHRRSLPGSPDLVFAKLKLALFVHGCFWHAHPGCPRASIPSSNTAFWSDKLARNQRRDDEVQQALRAAGWKVEVLWECEVQRPAYLHGRLRSILGSKSAETPILPEAPELSCREEC